MVEKIISAYPNHVLQDGLLYRGYRQRVIVKPINGEYKIKYKNKVHYHTMNELLNITKESTEKDEIKIDKKELMIKLAAGYDIRKGLTKEQYADIRAECNQHTSLSAFCTNVDLGYSAFRSWVLHIRKVKLSDLSKQHKYDMLLKYYHHKNRQFKSITDFCNKNNVDYKSFKYWMINYKGLVCSELTIEQNQPYMVEYKTTFKNRG